jgi:hypothetical protein
MNQVISNNCLYIPNTFGLDTEYIKFIFERDYCKVNQIELFGKLNTNGKAYTSARIHIGEWYSNIVSNNFIRRLQNNNYARVIYDDGSEMYWNVMPNKSRNVRQPRVNLDNKSLVPEIKEEQCKTDSSPMLSNSDFAAMYKSENIADYDDIEFRSACRRLVIDDDCQSTMALVSDDYVLKLEEIISQQNQKIEELTHQLTKLKKML